MRWMALETDWMHQGRREMCQAFETAWIRQQTQQDSSVHVEIQRKRKTYLLKQGDATRHAKHAHTHAWYCERLEKTCKNISIHQKASKRQEPPTLAWQKCKIAQRSRRDSDVSTICKHMPIVRNATKVTAKTVVVSIPSNK